MQRSINFGQNSPQNLVYEPLEMLLVRAPLLPIEEYLNLSTLYDIDEDFVQKPIVQRALAVGSLAILDEMERNSSSLRDITRRKRKLLRYLIRMTTRPTPYGLFAGVALAYWDVQTDLSIADRPRSLYTRPDMGWLFNIIWKLESLTEVRKYLYYITNTAAYARRGRIFLLEQLPSGSPMSNESVSLRATNVALRALKLARNPIAHEDLINTLLYTTPGATIAQCEELLFTLWRHTLLFTDLRPPLTGGNPIHYLLRRLREIPVMIPLIPKLQDFVNTIDLWDSVEDNSGVASYRNLAAKAEQIEKAVDVLLHTSNQARAVPNEYTGDNNRTSDFVQVDSTIHLVGSHLAKRIGNDVAQAAELMLRLSRLPEGYHYLQEYRQSFLSRYGQDREVPLLELLDPQIGLGVPPVYKQVKQDNITLSAFPEQEQELLHLAIAALDDKRLVSLLDKESLMRLETNIPAVGTIPSSLDIYTIVASKSKEAIDQGEYLLIVGPNIGALQAGRNLGRFASSLGADAINALHSVSQREAAQASSPIQAELVYLPINNRSANLVIRPMIEKFEVVTGIMPGVEHQQVIPLDELVVGVRNDRFYVRWPVQNTEVIFRFGHMVRASTAPSIIRFLSEIASDHITLLTSFNWGRCRDFPFLPRIQVGNIVLSLAQWRINATFHLSDFVLSTSMQFIASLEHWRKHWNVPRYVFLEEGVDHRMLLDLESSAQAEELRTTLQQIKIGQQIILQEGLPGPEHAWLIGPGGHYISEFVVSLVARQTSRTSEAFSVAHVAPFDSHEEENTKDIYKRPPGSDWLFMKLYCAPALQDELVAGPLRAFAQDALTKNLANSWFFIRYVDPDPHIRLRFQGDPQVLTNQLIPALCIWGSHLLSMGPCLKYTFDVYEREVDRYGGTQSISIAEESFCVDSYAVAELLHLKRKGVVNIDILTLAVICVDDLLAGFGLLPEERLQWYKKTVSLQKDSGNLYRQKGAELRALLGSFQSISQMSGGEELLTILSARRSYISEVSRQLSEQIALNALNQPLIKIYQSFVHMHCNRLFGVNQEMERMVLQLLLRTWIGLEKAPLR